VGVFLLSRHATAAETVERQLPQERSCILFCSGKSADDKGVLAVDTIFWISAGHEWLRPSEPPRRYSQDVENHTDLWKFHLKFGGHDHAGKYTYEAALYPQADCRYSRLPLDENGHRAQAPLTSLSADLQARIKSKRHGKHPVLLSGTDLSLILKLVDDGTAVAVVGGIVPTDDTLTRERDREGAGCTSCPLETRKPRGHTASRSSPGHRR